MDEVIEPARAAVQKAIGSGKAVVEKFEGKIKTEVKDWKSKLSAGLDNRQVIVSLVILGIFYTAYAITNYSLGNTRDLYSITSGCHCRRLHRCLYRWFFGVFSGLWILVHTYISISKHKTLRYYFCCCYRCYEKGYHSNNPSGQAGKRKGKQDEPDCSGRDKMYIANYEAILWYRYYKLYVSGYSKDVVPKTKTTDHHQNNKGTVNDSDNQYPCCCSESQCCTSLGTIKCRDFRNLLLKVKKLVRFVLLILKYIAQGATVPILMLQVFDTYALLCFSPNGEYCRKASEYEIHLTQAAITISFYFCIAAAQLANTLLEWEGEWKRRAVSDDALRANYS